MDEKEGVDRDGGGAPASPTTCVHGGLGGGRAGPVLRAERSMMSDSDRVAARSRHSRSGETD